MPPVHSRPQVQPQHNSRFSTKLCQACAFSCFVLILTGMPDGLAFSAPNRRLSPSVSLHQEEAAGKPQPPITAEQAKALAINDLQATPEGYALRHPEHTARFTAEEVHFTARRGGLDWHWQLTHIGTQHSVLKELNLGAVMPKRETPESVSYERGGGLVERYVVQVRGIEQQFVITQPLALNDTDLMIRGRVRSEGKFATTPKGWEWRKGEGVVSLGTVKVVDATGAAVPATMEVTAQETRITVNGAALARATYPVTIDPEIGTNDFRISDMGPDGNANFNATDPAIAYNSTNNQYLVVWRGTDNTGLLVDNENEIFGQRINALTGAEVGSDFRISDMGPDGDTTFKAFSPAVAYNSTNNEYLVVWRGDDNIPLLVDEEFEIFGQWR